jgi:hypothetical protein
VVPGELISSGASFERILETCIESGSIGGEGFAVDASLIEADANRQRSIPGVEWKKQIDPTAASRGEGVSLDIERCGVRGRDRGTAQANLRDHHRGSHGCIRTA